MKTRLSATLSGQGIDCITRPKWNWPVFDRRLLAKYEKRIKISGIFVIGIILILMLGISFYGEWWASVFFIPYYVIFVKRNVRSVKRKEAMEIQQDFIDGIVAMSFALQAGYSVDNAFLQASNELEELKEGCFMAKEFRIIGNAKGRNERPEKILYALGEKYDLDDIKEFAQVLECAGKTGGNLVAIIRQTAECLKEKQSINREVQTIISGKKYEQKILCAMPLFIIFYLRISAGEFIDPMYGNVFGIVSMSICAVVYLFATEWAHRLACIELN